MNEAKLRKELTAAREALNRATNALEGGRAAGAAGLSSSAEAMFEERRRRDACFPAGLFAEPQWDMLLVLFKAYAEQRELRQLDIFNEAGVPHTTGLRMIEQLERSGLVERRPGDTFLRKRLVRLTKDAVTRMEQLVGGGA